MPDRPASRHRDAVEHLLVLVLGATAMLLALPAAAVADGLPIQVSFPANSSVPTAATVDTWTVPAGVSEVTFYVAGGDGGSGGNGGGPGGGGGSAEADFAVAPGQTFTITVGGQGADGGDPAPGIVAAGGAGGAPAGGPGGTGGTATISTAGILGGGGGGGGASSVSLPSGGETSLLLVAPGGGGGGAGSGASGGDPSPADSSAGGSDAITTAGPDPVGGTGASAAGSDVADGAGGSGGLAGASAAGGSAAGGGAGTATDPGAGGAGTPPGVSGSATGGGEGPSGSGAGGGGDGFFGGGSGGGAPSAAGGGGGGGFYVSDAVTAFTQLAPSTVGSVSIGYTPTPTPPPPPPPAAPPGPPTPYPAIVGTPAAGQPLTCVATSAAPAETFTYRWLRDLAPVAGATGQTYAVTATDAGHYLQCVVTGTTSGGTVSGTSAFVAVPVEGAPPTVVTSSFVAAAHAAAVRVVVRCSPRAAGACAITLLLTSVETERAGRLVAVSAGPARPAARAARRPPSLASRHARAPRSTERTVVVGMLALTLTPGAVRAVLVPLNTFGRLLLARERRLPVLLSADGTLIGAVSAPLGSARLTLRVRSDRAARRLAGRRG